jgi:hypothetical protein
MESGSFVLKNGLLGTQMGVTPVGGQGLELFSASSQV